MSLSEGKTVTEFAWINDSHGCKLVMPEHNSGLKISPLGTKCPVLGANLI